MKHALGVKGQAVFDDWLRGLPIGKRTCMRLDLCYRLGRTAARADPVDFSRSRSRDIEISLLVESNAVGSRSAGGKSLSTSRLGWVEVRSSDAHHLAKASGCNQEIALLVECQA